MAIIKSTVLDFLKTSTAYHDSSLKIVWSNREGFLHLRNGAIVAAEFGDLTGNGAALDMARWKLAEISELESNPVIKKNVYLSIKEIERIFHDLQIEHLTPSDYDDQAELEQAVLLIHQFRYREAGALLSKIIKYNRFNYIAWIWYSRLLGNMDSIRKAVDEAQKWGDHEPDVYRELKKIGVGMADISEGKVKRCLFCWTPLNPKSFKCSYCHSLQSIKKEKHDPGIRKSDLKESINLYIGGLKQDRQNGHTGYTLAVGLFNLGMKEKALQYLDYILKKHPTNQVYSSARQLLTSMMPKRSTVLNKGAKTATNRFSTATSVANAQDSTTILVVEDSPTARKVIKMVLTREGFGIVEASSGEEALQQAKTARPNLVLLDVMLPDMSGFDVLPLLREQEHLIDIPVVMLTGKKGSADRMKGMLAGSAEYLTKPFDPKKLTNVIKKYV
jgi:twitching motility two-component system response regulator PilG